jgi:small-conductance mechanosensitive channel
MQNLIATVERTLGWLPDRVVGVALLVLAVALALAVHAALVRLARRALAPRAHYLPQLIDGTAGLTRLGILILVLALFVQAAPFTAAETRVINHTLLLAFIVLVGWAAERALLLVSTIHLRRFRLDVEDNLTARKHVTQVRVLRRVAAVLIVVVTVGAALMTFEGVRQYGVSLLASAGAAGIVLGLAAQPVLSNLIAGVQLAITQPIRIDDAVVVEGEFGTIEEITATYVVIRLWDLRRLVVPLSHFIDRPFQNWTRQSAAILGTAILHVDYTVPVGEVRRKLEEIVRASPLWDGEVLNLKVVEAREQTIELRALFGAAYSGDAFNLGCEVRERLIGFLQEHHPDALPRRRAELFAGDGAQPMPEPMEPRDRA